MNTGYFDKGENQTLDGNIDFSILRKSVVAVNSQFLVNLVSFIKLTRSAVNVSELQHPNHLFGNLKHFLNHVSEFFFTTKLKQIHKTPNSLVSTTNLCGNLESDLKSVIVKFFNSHSSGILSK